ncbi:glycoside-pentoside-hexuronide (GPH):cation symporter [Microbulbifer hydrolyticus]|uniref:GPH family glycoside/pentoside/hexuronide:cation symporter n=1 Tax=Microbulbifer hydrolyticus TaxID=48074 RepID=A0A6P1TES4_9GAMM|nr:MFS transporter [Microbulbifer hydrolyticus]MBB5212532.1 GPH family glycoside/pentoside/hexuronide:cation symporter [Microbulbifer hydrolyticus]QHQ40153.1 MFS transporter [Microbulbifer hydrolyticus]
MQSSAISIREKIGYGLGDTASNIVFQVVINFLLVFYTDVFGISAAAAGTLLLVVRIFDGITDPVVGGMADRTRSRWGRYRPYLLLMALPYAGLAVLAFTTPDLGENGKLVYAYITYTLLMTVYTAINIPYSALGGVITEDTTERASIQSYRFAMAMVGGALVSALTLPLVNLLGQGDKAFGYQMAMAVMAAVAALCFFVCFWSTRERVQPEADESGADKFNVKNFAGDFFNLFRNSQWAILAGATFFLLVLVAMRGAVTPFYVTYYFQSESLVSMFVTLPMLAGVAGAVSTNFLTKRFCKVRLFNWSMIGVIVTHAALLPLGRNQVYVALALAMAANFVHMIAIPLVFSMVPDAVDWFASKGHAKKMAMAYSGHLMALKLGLAVGGACAGWLLGYFDYVPNAEQSERTLNGIVLIYAAGPVICTLITMAIFRRYLLTNAVMAAGESDVQAADDNDNPPKTASAVSN